MSQNKDDGSVNVFELENCDIKTKVSEGEVVENFEYPVLALRDMVVFPGNSASLFIGRPISLNAAKAAYQFNTPLLLLTQKEAEKEIPEKKDLYDVGILAQIKRYVVMPDGTLNLAVMGLDRVKVKKINLFNEFYTAKVVPYSVEKCDVDSVEIQALVGIIAEFVKSQSGSLTKFAKEEWINIRKITDARQTIVVANNLLDLKTSEKQELLECNSDKEILEKVMSLFNMQKVKLEVEKNIKDSVRNQMEKNQKEYYLSEQLRAINKELGSIDGRESDIDIYKNKIEQAKMSEEATKKAKQELNKLKTIGPMSPETTIIRNYLDCMLDLPWKAKTPAMRDLDKAIKILDEDHYGLEKVKERIIEFLAVQARSKKLRSPILCLVGAPGVGKTSLGRSIARATGRKFVRASLGGMRDEAEIRGHRRTYVGAMPGKIIQSIKKVGVTNPLFLLDEIDKLGADWRGDPSSALLEVLDPEQNTTFNDHYLDFDYDLSNVMFVTTANSLNMPRPLLDRMEIIHIDGYTEEEKIEISKRHLLPKVFEENAIKKNELVITDEAIRDVIRYYTSESGVRNLERELATIARKTARDIMLKKDKKPNIKVDEKCLEKYLGVRKYHINTKEKKNLIGVATGLAWTEVGGDMLFIEAVDMPGKGVIKQTGKLGEVMKESIDTAYSVIRSQALDLGISPNVFENIDIHVHVPEGAIPKDGPSAGITMYTTLVSVLTKIPVRNDVAMTGEITLQGRVLPIGGLKEKLLSALRGGIRTVIIPKANEKDLRDLPKNVLDCLEIVLVEDVSKVLEVALESPIKPLKRGEFECSSNKHSDA